MSRQDINIGVAPDDHTGDPLRTAFDKINQNLTEVYAHLGGDTPTEPAPPAGVSEARMLFNRIYLGAF